MDANTTTMNLLSVKYDIWHGLSAFQKIFCTFSSRVETPFLLSLRSHFSSIFFCILLIPTMDQHFLCNQPLFFQLQHVIFGTRTYFALNLAKEVALNSRFDVLLFCQFSVIANVETWSWKRLWYIAPVIKLSPNLSFFIPCFFWKIDVFSFLENILYNLAPFFSSSSE